MRSVSLLFLNYSFIRSIFIVFYKYTELWTDDDSHESNDRAALFVLIWWDMGVLSMVAFVTL